MIGVFYKRRVPQIKIISRKMTHKFFNRINIEFIKVLFALFRNELQRSKVHNNLKISEDATVFPSVLLFQRNHIIIYWLTTEMEVHVAVGILFGNFVCERFGFLFLYAFAVIEGNHFVLVVFKRLYKLYGRIVYVVAFCEYTLVVKTDYISQIKLEYDNCRLP